MPKIPDKFTLIKCPWLAGGMIRKLHWNGQIYCPHCGCINDIIKHSKMKNGVFRYFCKNCEKTFTDLTGTIFENSKVSLWKWLYGLISLFESTGCLSAAELSRNIKVSYPTAWNMLNRLRKLLIHQQYEGKLKGVIESDEAWLSHKNNQQIVLGIVEREGKIKMFPIIDRKEDQLLYPHLWYVEKGSMICTDSLPSYGGLSIHYIHHWVNHSAGEFTRNHIWTNTIEGVWAQLKGVIRTIHHGIKKEYMPDYMALFCFKYNNRTKSLDERLSALLDIICQPRSCLY